MGKYDCVNCVNDAICDLEARKDHAYNLRDGTKDCFKSKIGDPKYTEVNLRKLLEKPTIDFQCWPCTDLTYSYKLESARHRPDLVPSGKWPEYFNEVFDMLRAYEETANAVKGNS